MSWTNYTDKLKRYFPFSQTEWKNFSLLVLACAVIWSFTQWGTANFDLALGLKNLLAAVVIAAVVIFLHHAAQRLYGIWFGYRIEHKIWWAGLLAGILSLILSNGKVIIFAASVMQAHFLPAHRLGTFRYGPSLQQLGLVAFVGPIFPVIIALLLYLLLPVKFLADLLSFSIVFGVYNLLPVPPLDGFHVFAGSRLAYGATYAFITSALFGFLIVYFLTSVGFWLSVLAGIAVGVLGWIAYVVMDL
jgi:hypothetical protein